MISIVEDNPGSVRAVADDSGNVLERDDYLPYGERVSDPALARDGNEFLYGRKEIKDKFDVDWYDSGARYQTTSGIFSSIDPQAEKHYGISPYVYCSDNPVNLIDPDGKNPIYDPDGNLIGTDDNGLKGDAIIMNKSDFRQGMSYDDAMKNNLGLEGLTNQEATDKYTSSFKDLKDRPDWDGYLTFNEANNWYQNGNGQPLFLSLDQIDLSGIFSLGDKYVGQIKTFNSLLVSDPINGGLVYGQITL